jgi:NADP-dependent 3-hydroxy acid dehydrogenase YdfG
MKVFPKLGAQVAITSRDIDKLKNTASELEATTGTCLPLQCDVITSGKHVAKRIESFGKVDVLLNNAAEISFPNRKIICERF